MRYVSNIITSNGFSVPSMEYDLNFTPPCSLSVIDTQSGGEQKNFLGYDCIGCGIDFINVRGLAVRHTVKTASLHQYVRMADTRHGVSPIDYKEQDVISLGGEKNLLGSSVVSIYTKDETVSVYGREGSVCSWDTSSTSRELITLYDLLLRLCDMTELNLLTYETIQIGSVSRLYRTVIRLLHNSDAEVFYTKMLCVG